MTERVQEATGAEDIVWNLGDMYAGVDDPALEADQQAMTAKCAAFAEKYRGRVGTLSAADMAEALTDLEIIYDRVARLGSFASLQWTIDMGNAAYGALLQKIQEFGSQLQQQILFFELEWANVSDEQARIADDPALARWRHYLKQAREERPYLLTEPEERILAEKAVTGVQAWNRFFGQVLSATQYELDGQKLPQEALLRRMYSPDRDERRRAADALTVGLRANLPTAIFVFNTILADKASNDRLRKNPTWISSRNRSNEISDESVEALVKAVTSRYDIVARYYNIKRRLLGYDTLYEYDRYAPLQQVDTQHKWTEARDIVLNAYHAFDPLMAQTAGEFFEKRWIHAPVKAGKRGGAFASPVTPSLHPYVMVNYTGSSKDVMTLAHELGHGIHMMLSRPKGIFEAQTPLTTAEMASTFGEMLVFTDLMNRESDPQARAALLATKIEDSFATVFRQISMNRFEDAIHTARRMEGELSADRIGELWMTTQRAMFGDSVTLRDEYTLWWSYITHFTNVPGYVYAYAFGELLVMSLFARYRHEGAAFAPKYLDVLSMGGADRPENILRIAGVDLTNPNFWQEGLNIIDDMVTQLESMVK
ncbi:MAG TPA: M3 family oligoendopeptidase [Aggregatilineales bacterium]|nr:M3 family oligoendopeptidase [Aggregatilineales bacterium]